MPLKTIKGLLPLRYRKMFSAFRILRKEYAQYNSMKEMECIDKGKNAIPWYTYPAIEYLDNLDLSSARVFEFGSGNSSLFWSKKAQEVISIEHNVDWHRKVSASRGENQTILLSSDDEGYERTIEEDGRKFDVIIIDGIRRPQCARRIGPFLNDSNRGAMVILDNSDWYPDTAKYLRESLHLIQVDFHGFGPINGYTWTTSVFLTRDFDIKPINGIQPHFSLGAVRQSGENAQI